MVAALGERRSALRASRSLFLSVLKTSIALRARTDPTVFQHLLTQRRHLCRYRQTVTGVTVCLIKRRRQANQIGVETEAMEDKPKTFKWEWEDGETGEIRTIEIAITIRANRKRSFSSESYTWTTWKSRTGSRSSRRENLTDGPPK